MSELEKHDNNTINVPDSNYNEIEDKIFDFIGKELVSESFLNFGADRDDNNYTDSYSYGNNTRKNNKFSKYSSKINSAYESIRQVHQYNISKNKCVHIIQIQCRCQLIKTVLKRRTWRLQTNK